jgi:hypothetical protein
MTTVSASMHIGKDGLIECPVCGKTNTLTYQELTYGDGHVYNFHFRCKKCWNICRLTFDLSGAGVRVEITQKMRLNIMPDYREYIASDMWKQRALEAKERVSWKCQLCNKPGENGNLHTHHRTYENLGNERPEDITVLCADCHAKFHDKEPA